VSTAYQDLDFAARVPLNTSTADLIRVKKSSNPVSITKRTSQENMLSFFENLVSRVTCANERDTKRLRQKKACLKLSIEEI